MTDESSGAHKTMLRAIRKAFSPSDLEKSANFFESHLNGLNIKGLPEYTAAVEAHEALQDAAGKHYESEHTKRQNDSPEVDR
ncbi:MAG: hypothetical protein IIA87_04120 [Nanoarchaeota archaeon]|nr:hypothetical protein [Nanoarchaeota archaeon]